MKIIAENHRVIFKPETMNDAFRLGRISGRYSCTVKCGVEDGSEVVELLQEDVVNTLFNAAGKQ